jgi:hypothetical protein
LAGRLERAFTITVSNSLIVNIKAAFSSGFFYVFFAIFFCKSFLQVFFASHFCKSFLQVIFASHFCKSFEKFRSGLLLANDFLKKIIARTKRTRSTFFK